MCQRSPGPRCASHARKAVQDAAKELETLEKGGADETAIKKAKRTLAEAVKIYDSTPTGQKKLTEKIAALTTAKESTRAAAKTAAKELGTLQKNRADEKDISEAKQKLADAFAAYESAKTSGDSTRSLSSRLTAGRLLREKQTKELAKVIKCEQAAVAKAKRLEEMREEQANKPANSFKTAVTSYVLKEGMFLKEQYWGGPSEDYEAKEHMERCGVAHTGETSESYSWQNYDSFSTQDHVGFSMNTTCNCGEIFERPMVIENATMSSVMQGILNE
jgi:hypothetical protein